MRTGVSAHRTAPSDHSSSREHAWLKFEDLCAKNSLSSTRHVSFLAAHDTDHQHKFSLTYLSNLAAILFYTQACFPTIHIHTATIHGGVAVRARQEDQTRARIMEGDYQSPITEDMDEFRKNWCQVVVQQTVTDTLRLRFSGKHC